MATTVVCLPALKNMGHVNCRDATGITVAPPPPPKEWPLCGSLRKKRPSCQGS